MPHFEVYIDLIDVSCMSRPNTAWKHVDHHGHTHQWYRDGKPATDYDPAGDYESLTLTWILDGTGYYEDGEEYDIGHYECRQCGDRVNLDLEAFTADTTRQFIQGLPHFLIDGREVSEEEFRREFEKGK
jgi:hypothetical protein